MDYLEAAIGLSIVLATFAAAVTALVQAVWRTIRVKQGNLISVLKRLDSEVLSKSSLRLSPEERWNTIVQILNNPLKSAGGLPLAAELASNPMLPRRWFSRSNGQAIGDSNAAEFAIKQLSQQNALSNQYEKVSSEHVVRRLLEAAAGKVIGIQQDRLQYELNNLVTKFEEFSSAMSAEFKRRSHWWSVAIGILVAVMFNVNGVTIFREFVENPGLTNNLSVNTELTAKIEAEPLKDFYEQIRALEAKSVPIGFRSWPHECTSKAKVLACLFTGIQPEQSFSKNDIPAFLGWFFACVMTGLLLGLGAPFWFDVATRLTAVRTLFGGKPTTSKRLSGAEAEGDPEKRASIVDTVMTETQRSNEMIHRKRFRNIPDNSQFTVQVTDNNGKTFFDASLLAADETEIEWSNQEVRDGDAKTKLLSDKLFYVFEMLVSFTSNDTASIALSFTNSPDDWTFSLDGTTGQVAKVNARIFMS